MELTSGQQVKLARLRLGMTLAEVSKKSTYSASYLCMIEQDQRPVPKYLTKLLKVDEALCWYNELVEAIKDRFKDRAEDALRYLNTFLGL